MAEAARWRRLIWSNRKNPPFKADANGRLRKEFCERHDCSAWYLAVMHQIQIGRSNGSGHSSMHEETIPLKGPCVSTRQRERERQVKLKERCISVLAISLSVVAVIVGTLALVFAVVGPKYFAGPAKAEKVAELSLTADRPELNDELGRYILEDYDAQPPFSDFLPALAGLYGKPLYAFYVNRGQGIASFGIKSKDYPIMEFNSANKAYQSSAILGFRTFLQASRKGHDFWIEPFSPMKTRFSGSTDENGKKLPKRHMYVGSNEVQVQEMDHTHGIETNVTYFILPEEDFGAFVKRTRITNTDPDSPLTLSMLDGLAKIEPAGGKLDGLLKNIGRTLEGWMGVYQADKDSIRMPFFRLSTQASDLASVVVQEAGHWCLSMVEYDGDYSRLLPIIYDTSKVFGEDTSLLSPVGLRSKSIGDILKEPQYGFAKTSSAFAAVDTVTLAPGETLTVSTFFGKAETIKDVPSIAGRITQAGYVQYKSFRTREIIKQITAGVETNTANQLFNGHVQQMFLDNSLRGGIPTILGEIEDDDRLMNADEDSRLKVYHVFSRIHGDLERDYNDFEIPPTYFSEGPGNFRDVAQNRRNDVLFNPRMGSFNVKSFLSFIQADAYEPLTVEAVVFLLRNRDVCEDIATHAVGEADGHRAQREALTEILNSGPFRPGQLFLLLEEQDIKLIISGQKFIDIVAAAAEYFPMAVYKTGFWADHWTYYVDLIESYLSIYPDWEERIMFDESLPYFFSPAVVVPREKKYVLSTTFDGKGKHVRQLNSTIDDDEGKIYQSQYISNATGWFDFFANWQHDGKGKMFMSSPIAKLFLLGTLKFATRDAYGMGIEYEGGRPGWDDANNGLVGMLGSGMPETFELAVLLRYILSVITKYKRSIIIPSELNDLIESVDEALETLSSKDHDAHHLEATVPPHLFDYWDSVASAREFYREKTKVVFSGSIVSLSPEDVASYLEKWLDEIDKGIERALQLGSQGYGDDGLSGLTPTYFSYNVTEWERTGAVGEFGHSLVIAKKMEVNLFPLFLEGPTRMMKTTHDAYARAIYNKVKASPLHDKALGMYTISASLKGQNFDMGREMAFAPGWLENQSIWMHMSYKFYLELLRHGLFHEFFSEMTSGGMLPFMDEKLYGRSLMECSSFIASSAFEDPSVRGRGFLARLSGSTAEFLSMWALMMIGPNPFFVDEETGELRMQFLPAIPRWLFEDSDGSVPHVSFKLFGAIDVTYYNWRGDDDLYRLPPARYMITLRDGNIFNIPGSSIPFKLADKIRRVVFVASIDVHFQ